MLYVTIKIFAVLSAILLDAKLAQFIRSEVGVALKLIRSIFESFETGVFTTGEVAAGGTVTVAAGGTIKSISIGNTGSGYRAGIQTVNVGIQTLSRVGTNVIGIGTAQITTGHITGIAVTNADHIFYSPRKVANVGYSSVTGISTITTQTDHGLSVGDEVRLSGIAFTCDYSPRVGIHTAVYDNISGNGESLSDYEGSPGVDILYSSEDCPFYSYCSDSQYETEGECLDNDNGYCDDENQLTQEACNSSGSQWNLNDWLVFDCGDDDNDGMDDIRGYPCLAS